MPKHYNRGRVSEVREHPDGKHVTVHVKHGRTKKPKGKDAAFMPPFDDRRESQVVLPKAMAKHYPVGAHVAAGLAPAADLPDDEQKEPMMDDEAAEGEAPANGKGGKRAMKKGHGKSHGKQGATKRGAKGATRRKKAPPSMIEGAMMDGGSDAGEGY